MDKVTHLWIVEGDFHTCMDCENVAGVRNHIVTTLIRFYVFILKTIHVRIFMVIIKSMFDFEDEK